MRSCVLYAAAILSRRRTISAHPVINSSTVVKGVEELTSMNVDADINVIGGGGINEKPRLYKPNNDNSINSDGDKGDYFGSSIWNPSKNVSHMLHAIVGIDRYPNYLNRLNDLSDIDSLEEALEARLSDVRRQRSEIIQRRAGMKQLVRRGKAEGAPTSGEPTHADGPAQLVNSSLHSDGVGKSDVTTSQSMTSMKNSRSDAVQSSAAVQSATAVGSGRANSSFVGWDKTKFAVFIAL